MKGLKPKWPGPGRLRRTVLTVAAAGATVGGMLLIAAPANAFVGTDPTPGTVVLSPATGTSTTTTTFTTTDGCPTGFQTSAELQEVVQPVTSPPTFVTVSGAIQLSGGNPITVSQGLQDTVLNLLAGANVAPGGSTEWVLKCSSLASGLGSGSQVVFYQNILVTENAAGTGYSTSAPAAAVNTTTSLSASPNPANTGATVTLTATVTGVGNPAGTVTFFNGTTAINTTPAAVTYTGNTGTATTTTSFSAVGSVSLSATFTPTNTTGFNGSTGTATESVQSSATQTAGTVPVSLTIAPTGSFSISIPTATAILTPNTAGTLATGNLGVVTVSDTRNSFPGWAVYGQETANFVGSGLPTGVTSFSIPSDNLGWTPAGTVTGGATLGPAAADIGATAGPKVLAQALAGFGDGTDTLNPALSLTLPAGTPTGTYTGGVVITYITVAP